MYVCGFLDLDGWQFGSVLQSKQNQSPGKINNKVLKEGFEEWIHCWCFPITTLFGS